MHRQIGFPADLSMQSRYKLNRPTALLTGFYFYSKNQFKSLRPGHRLVFGCSMTNRFGQFSAVDLTCAVMT
ncbi:MAG: hypothetical protein ACJAVV_003232 [Alphaproteobacteria bacterium]